MLRKTLYNFFSWQLTPGSLKVITTRHIWHQDYSAIKTKVLHWTKSIVTLMVKKMKMWGQIFIKSSFICRKFYLGVGGLASVAREVVVVPTMKTREIIVSNQEADAMWEVLLPSHPLEGSALFICQFSRSPVCDGRKPGGKSICSPWDKENSAGQTCKASRLQNVPSAYKCWSKLR